MCPTSNPRIRHGSGKELAERRNTATLASAMTELEILDRIQRRVLWLGTFMVHHANVIRPNEDGIKVGGHQASSASVVTLLTALYFNELRAGAAVSWKAQADLTFFTCNFLS